MKERPILFSAPMVRAILDGTKTQTRRVAPINDLTIKPQGDDIVTWAVSFSKTVKGVFASYSGGKFTDEQARRIIASQFCPYGQPGDRLWVRETWMDLRGTGVEHRPTPASALQRYAYAADTPRGSYGDEARKEYGLKWRPSIHMPRAVSRINLEVTGVRVERLQDISEADALAEGIEHDQDISRGNIIGWRDYLDRGGKCGTAKGSYQSLWAAINGQSSWDANPWVWVVEFKATNQGGV
jgi:hypothetical protein